MPESLPTVDVSAFATGAAPSAAQDAVAADIDRICREIGFFLITGHGVEPAAKATMMTAMQDFFALPEPAKLELAIRNSKAHRGYVAIAAEVLDDVNETAGDLKESLDTGGEHGPDHPEVLAGVPLHGPNQFPAPAFRASWEVYRGAGDRGREAGAAGDGARARPARRLLRPARRRGHVPPAAGALPAEDRCRPGPASSGAVRTPTTAPSRCSPTTASAGCR